VNKTNLIGIFTRLIYETLNCDIFISALLIKDTTSSRTKCVYITRYHTTRRLRFCVEQFSAFTVPVPSRNFE